MTMLRINEQSQSIFWAALAFAFALLISGLPIEMTAVLLTAILIIVGTLFSPMVPFAFVLILAPLRTLVATESSWSLPIDIGLILFALALLLVTTRAWLTDQVNLRYLLNPITIALVSFIAIAGISVVNAQSLTAWFFEWVKWIIGLVIIMMLLSLPQWQRNLAWIASLVIIAAFANAIIGIYIFFGGSGADHLVISGRFFRAFGTFGQPNPFGAFMGIAIPLAASLTLANLLNLWQRPTQRLQSAFFVGCFGITTLVLLAAILTSWSRGAWLSLVTAAGIMLFALPRRFWQQLAFTTLGASILAIAWFGGIIPEAIATRVTSSVTELVSVQDVRGVDITSENYAIVERVAHWQAAARMGREHPWLGVGFGNYEAAYPQYQLLNWPEALGHAHNYYLNVFAETGIVGAFAYSLLWAVILSITWRGRRHPDRTKRLLSIGLLGSFAYILTHSLLDNLYVNNLIMHISLLIGIAVIISSEVTRSFLWRPKPNEQRGSEH